MDTCRRCKRRPATVNGLCGPCQFSRNNPTGGATLCAECRVRRAADGLLCARCQREQDDEATPWPYNLM